MNKCPNCNKKIEKISEYIDMGHICESHSGCPEGCYEEIYGYGYTDINLLSNDGLRVSFSFNYKSSDSRLKEIEENILKFFKKFKKKKNIG